MKSKTRITRGQVREFSEGKAAPRRETAENTKPSKKEHSKRRSYSIHRPYLPKPAPHEQSAPIGAEAADAFAMQTIPAAGDDGDELDAMLGGYRPIE